MHHWTPSMVDEQPWWLIEQLPLISKAYSEVEELQRERAEQARPKV